ncbi:MAG: GSU2403 family nucleotidyltransferase fold protein, partial [Acidiferrobacterales bacterium]|nr:GSU2403 family nucleotidyltransferase fold protein [Acidiferrobacterales bacterium]
MTIQRYSAQLQAAYSELVEQLSQAEIEQLAQHEGAFGSKTVKGIKYWYFRRRAGDRYDERYLGPETRELLDRIKTLKIKAGQAKEAARERRGLIRQLRAGGYLAPDRRTGRVLEELARAGVFRLNGVLVGTHAFRCYPGLLGVKLEMQLAMTADVDLAQDASVSLAVTDVADP